MSRPGRESSHVTALCLWGGVRAPGAKPRAKKFLKLTTRWVQLTFCTILATLPPFWTWQVACHLTGHRPSGPHHSTPYSRRARYYYFTTIFCILGAARLLLTRTHATINQHDTPTRYSPQAHSTYTIQVRTQHDLHTSVRTTLTTGRAAHRETAAKGHS